MVKSNPIQVLTGARERGLSWRPIVEAMRELTASGSLDAQGRPWIEVAAHLAGYTTNQMRQAQRTYATIEQFIQTHDLPLHALEWPMSSLEVIARIAKANPQRAERLIISSTQLSLRGLSKLYEQIRADSGSRVSAMSAGHHSARAFTQGLFDALSDREAMLQLLGGGCATSMQPLKAWPGRYPFAHPDFVVGYYKSEIFKLAAFEGLRFYGDINLHSATKAAVKAAVEATFFAKYFWCLSEWTPVEHLVAMRNQLGLHNVGIVTTFNNTVDIVLRPSANPSPDRQEMLIKDVHLSKRLKFNQV
jgi:hypothetical protein